MKEGAFEPAGGDGLRARRGQTNLDFVVGVSLFVVAVVFVWVFLPNLFAPFVTGDAAGDGIVAERAAERLANGMHGNGSALATVEEDCLVAFFRGQRTDNRCGFNNATTVGERLGLRSNTPINVTIVGDVNRSDPPSTLCWEGEPEDSPPWGGFNESDNSYSPDPCDIRLAAGGQPGSSSEVSVARRAIRLGEQRATIVVRAW